MFKLTDDERVLILDHLNSVVQLSNEMNELRGKLGREQRNLETAWGNAWRRNIIETGGSNPAVPPFVGSDGMVNVNIAEDGTVVFAPGREPPPQK